ncbi:MAG: VOC family protein [Chloroflexi bacterium]|nr:VOC family protein [Chloroflexota bacterium]
MVELNWFEIPATNFARAVAFYNSVLNTTLREEVFMDIPNAIFMTADGRGIGSVVQAATAIPSRDGVLIYLDATGRLDAALALVTDNGGQVVMPRMAIGPQGWMAIIADSEGNHIGLHERMPVANPV